MLLVDVIDAVVTTPANVAVKVCPVTAPDVAHTTLIWVDGVVTPNAVAAKADDIVGLFDAVNTVENVADDTLDSVFSITTFTVL